jgi:hypothetical protein
MADISLRKVHDHIQRLVPQIQSLTGITPDVDALEVRLIKREEFWEQAVEPGMRYMGIDTTPKSDKARLEIAMMNLIGTRDVGALYEPRLNTCFFIPDNMKRSNDDGAALMIGHELLHCAQNGVTPGFNSAVQDITKMIIGTDYFEKDTGEVPEAAILMNRMMMLIEGYAHFYQTGLNRVYYPHAVIKPNHGLFSTIRLMINLKHTYDKFPDLMTQDEDTGEPAIVDKKSQYLGGAQIIERAYVWGGPKATLALFEEAGGSARTFIEGYRSRSQRIGDALRRSRE